MGQDAFVGTTFIVSALVTVGFFNGTEDAGQAIDILSTGGRASIAVNFEGGGQALEVLGASGGACCAVNFEGPG